MPFPLISEYIEAIKAAEDNFEKLTNLRPVLIDDGHPVMTSGNFAVVFKMEDIVTGKFYALKCFTKEQEGRAEAYHQIADALMDVDSPYLVSLADIYRVSCPPPNPSTGQGTPFLTSALYLRTTLYPDNGEKQDKVNPHPSAHQQYDGRPPLFLPVLS